MEIALNKEGYAVKWIKKGEFITEDLLKEEKYIGLLLNVIKEKSIIEKLC